MCRARTAVIVMPGAISMDCHQSRCPAPGTEAVRGEEPLDPLAEAVPASLRRVKSPAVEMITGMERKGCAGDRWRCQDEEETEDRHAGRPERHQKSRIGEVPAGVKRRPSHDATGADGTLTRSRWRRPLRSRRLRPRTN